MKSKFGKNLKDIRVCLDITLAEFSRRSGVTSAALCMIEQGKREPSLTTIIKILGVLGCSFERMLK